MSTIANSLNLQNCTFGDRTITTTTGALTLDNGINALGGAPSFIGSLSVGGSITLGGNSIVDCNTYKFNTTEGTDYLTLMGSPTGESGSGLNGLWLTDGVKIGNVYSELFYPPGAYGYGDNAAPVNLVANISYVAVDSGSHDPTSFIVPSTVPFGYFFTLAQKNPSGFTVQFQTGQTLFFGDKSTSSGGVLSTIGSNYAAVTFVCITDNTEFMVASSVGTLSLA